jgi:predicted lipoprotein with Yx(FWY)xxD motif
VSSLSLRTLAGLVAGAALLAVPASAAAGTPSLTVKSRASAAQNEKVLVTSSGRTLYRLKPETRHHWLCTSAACRQIWRPLLVSSSRTTLKRGSGVSGSLKLATRPDGKLQVAFKGFPLYTYAGDAKAGDVNGQNIHSFGGTWLVLRTGPLATPTPTPTPTPSPGPYGY